MYGLRSAWFMDERYARRPGRLKVTTWLIMGGEEIRSTVELDTKGLGALICCRVWEVASCGCIVLAVLWIWQVAAAAGAATAAASAEENKAMWIAMKRSKVICAFLSPPKNLSPVCFRLDGRRLPSHTSDYPNGSLGNCIFNPLYTASYKISLCLVACSTPKTTLLEQSAGRWWWHKPGEGISVWHLKEFSILRPHHQINIISCIFFLTSTTVVNASTCLLQFQMASWSAWSDELSFHLYQCFPHFITYIYFF